MKRWIVILTMLLAVIALVPIEGQAAISAKSIGERFGCTSGEALSAGNLVAIKDADGKCWKADSTDSTIRPAMGWVVQGYASGVSTQVVSRGLLTGFSALTKGAPVYLSTAGAYTQTAPAYPQVIGYAMSATDVRISIDRPLDSSISSTSLKKKMFVTTVENLAAAADIGDGTAANARTIFTAPSALTITDVKLYGRAASAGADATATATIKVYNATSTVVTKEYNGVTTWPAAFTPTSLGTVANASVTAGNAVKFDILTVSNNDAPAFDLYVEYVTTD